MSVLQPRSDSSSLPLHTWLGIAILIAGEAGILLHLPWVATWFTPIMWTGFILSVDGVLARLRGRSWLTTRRAEFPFLALTSIFIWLIFEVYNFRLQNWLYRGLPENGIVRDIGYFWSFATIAPAILIASELIYTLLYKFRRASNHPPSAIKLGPRWPWILLGFSMVAIPPMLPIPAARFTFGFVWIGFILLFDPINERLRAPSLRQELTSHPSGTLTALMAGGLLCGLLWEAWNFQALGAGGGHWVYKVPEQLRIFGLHYGQMPVLGLLGFPPFAVEVYVLYQTLRSVLDIDRMLGRWTL
jgi:hypothetical protein